MPNDLTTGPIPVEIRFTKPFPPIAVSVGANLMASLLEAGRTVASSCGGDGVCGKCKVRVIEGSQSLSPVDAREKLTADRLKIPPSSRLSCQATVRGTVTVDTSYW